MLGDPNALFFLGVANVLWPLHPCGDGVSGLSVPPVLGCLDSPLCSWNAFAVYSEHLAKRFFYPRTLASPKPVEMRVSLGCLLL